MCVCVRACMLACVHVRKCVWARHVGGHWAEGAYVAECKGQSFFWKKASLKASVHPRPPHHPPPSPELLEALITQGGSQQPGRPHQPSFPAHWGCPSWGSGPYLPPPSLTWD